MSKKSMGPRKVSFDSSQPLKIEDEYEPEPIRQSKGGIQYSIEVPGVASIEGEGKPRINAFAAQFESLPKTSADQVQSLHHNFLRGVQIAGDLPFLGTRPVTNGLAGPFIWQTYNEVFKRVRNLSSGLLTFPSISSGIPASIGLFALNRAEWIIAEQACFAISAITIPLFDMLSQDALKHILVQTGMETIIATRDKLIANGITSLHQIILMDGIDEEILFIGKELNLTITGMTDLERLGAKTRPSKPPTPPSGTSIATICYTSGTTGTPKGTVLTHTNCLALLRGISTLQSISHFTPITPSDVYISYLPLAHVFERTMVVNLIHVGAAIGFYQGDTFKLMDDVAELRPTIFPGVPRLFNRIYEKVKRGLKERAGGVYEWTFHRAYAAKEEYLKRGVVKHLVWDAIVFEGVKEKLGGRVRLMLTGAAPIGKSVLDSLRICFSATVLEGYGLTETCSSLTFTDENDCTPDQVGAPVPGCQVKLIDVPEMNYFSSSVPPRGEICVKGPNVFQGYYKNPEETAKVLDANGWFHTGDVGEWDAQGRLKLIDRKKSVFKLSQGEYIAPEKIESVLKSSDMVSQAFVYGDSLKPYLVAVLVPDRHTFMNWATKKQGFYHKNFKDLCIDPGIRVAFAKAMDEHGRAHGLKGFENVKAVYLESDADAFTIENGLLTPIFKLKRFVARETYKREIEEMYRGLHV
ncbi:acetyl-CoA synthetase-like protein [Rhizoclosmatium globosum]|uniref:Acetyl-CoA synthetase-like protein n=1 Tax=Rhizoclosmatium globosum TaxID=329046 RepID=A0A1Y2CT46_9FUNG|nr:acetyl-CoA synthetase-like protein [Rhizoclosmatium globosum]|eukprot:ORY50230.1 acetyl-CoA synthetase-like protein [Rhizoclosmatium globosum]